MASALVKVFCEAVVYRLMQEDAAELRAGRERAVVDFVAEEVGRPAPGKQLVSSLSGALMRCPDVLEIYLDDEELIELVADLSG